MQTARKFIQIVRFVLGAAVVMYFFLILWLPSSATPSPILLRAIGIVAIAEAILIFVMRRILVFAAETVLENQPEDPKALATWKTGYLITYAISLSIAMYGLVLHFLGFSFVQVVPFLLAGLALIAFLGPKVISKPSLSAPIVPQ